MKDICTDYCESTDCTNCHYRKATKEEKINTYEELSKCRTFVCQLRCNANDCRMDMLSEQ